MNNVNKTLYIPLYGKSKVSKQGIILKDSMAEKIWELESFKMKGKSKSKWLSYNMAMRARIFDDWTRAILHQDKEALVLHIGCGLDSRCIRINEPFKNWIDGDFPNVIEIRKKYYKESENYHMIYFDACESEQVRNLPDSNRAVVILEGISMYLKNEQLNAFLKALSEKYTSLSILMDVYTVWGAKASKYKNPINDVGVTMVWGIDDIQKVLAGTEIVCKEEHSLTPDYLVKKLKPFEQFFFRIVFSERIYRKIYRLYELEKGDFNMRIESIGINMQNFAIDVNTSIADSNESFSEIIDELSDEMSKTDTDVEHTKPMDYFLSEAEISLGLKKADMFPVVFAVEELSNLRSQNHRDNRQNLMNKAINAYNNSMGIFE